jgi:endonuclease YncB( thermonuclease family)
MTPSINAFGGIKTSSPPWTRASLFNFQNKKKEMKQFHYIALAAILLLLLASPSVPAAEVWHGRVVDVVDGDTITVEPADGGDRVRIRLHGVDAPERKQPFGEASREYATKIALYKKATINPQNRDRYGRVVAIVEIDGTGVLQEILLDNGMVWVYPQYCRNCREWKSRQVRAREHGKGLWTDKKATPPWEWRKRARSK